MRNLINFEKDHNFMTSTVYLYIEARQKGTKKEKRGLMKMLFLLGWSKATVNLLDLFINIIYKWCDKAKQYSWQISKCKSEKIDFLSNWVIEIIIKILINVYTWHPTSNFWLIFALTNLGPTSYSPKSHHIHSSRTTSRFFVFLNSRFSN